MEPETINERLLAAAGRYTYREIGDLTGLHPETIRRYMNGDPPSVEFLAAFCAGLSISADWMLFAQGPMSRAAALRLSLAGVSDEALFAALAGIPPIPPALESTLPGDDADDSSPLRRPAPDFADD